MSRATRRELYGVDYARRVTVPIRDMHHGGRVAFAVDVYGVEWGDLCVVPGGGEPALRAVERLGLDPTRYVAMIWDLGPKSQNNPNL